MGDANPRGHRTAVFLADFGLAKNVATGSRHTRTGATLGTPAYMSPELARGEVRTLTAATDTWALGCVLHEALAGVGPFQRETAAATIGAVLTTRPAPVPRVPAGVNLVIGVCFRRTPRERYADASALRADLDRVARGERPIARALRRGRGRGVLMGALFVLGGVGVAMWATPARRSAPTPREAPSTQAATFASHARSRRQADPAEAAVLLGRALQLAPSRHEWRVELGELLWLAPGPIAIATDCWAEVPAASPWHTRAQWLSGLAIGLEGFVELDRASRAAARAPWRVASTGEGPEARWARAGLLLLDGAPERTARELADETAWTPSALCAIAQLVLADSGHPDADLDAGEAAFSRAVSQGGQLAALYFGRAQLRARRKDRQGAIDDYTVAIRLRPNFARAFHNRATLHDRLGHTAAATADYDETIRLRPGDPAAWCNRGGLRLRQGEAAAAAADFTEAIAADPMYAPAYLSRARLEAGRGRLADARMDYDAAVRNAQGWAEPYEARAVFRRRQGDAPGAQSDFDEALRLDPTMKSAWFGRGQLHAAARNFAGACADYRAALRLDADFAEAHAELGLTLSNMGDWAAARDSLARFLALAPDHPAARAVQATLDDCERRIAAGRGR